MTLPTGWIQHPDNPDYAYFGSTGEVRAIAELVPAPAAYAPPAAATDPWGEQDMSVAEQDRQAAAVSDYARESNFFWLNFPELTGNEVSLLMRFFPPWAAGLQQAYVLIQRHRIYARFNPDAPDGRDVWFYDCLNSVGGPGNCPLCRTLLHISTSTGEGAADFGKMAKSKKGALWQGVNLTDPSAHYQKITDANGNETPGVVPGVLRCGTTLHSAILECFRFGDFTSPRRGFPIECIKKKGKMPKRGQMNVEYSAQHHAHMPGPIPDELFPALYNAIDLRAQCVYFEEAEKLEVVCANIMSEYGSASHAQAQVPAGYAAPRAQAPTGYAPPAPPPAAAAPVLPPGFLPHPQAPGYMYNPQTQAVLAIPAAMPPAPPAPPAAAPPRAPAAAPPAAAPPRAAPPPMLPPPTAPGLPAGALPPTPPAPPPGYLPPPVAAPGAPPMPPAQLETTFNTPPAPPAAPPAPPAPPAAPPLPPRPGKNDVPF